MLFEWGVRVRKKRRKKKVGREGNEPVRFT